MSKLKEWFMKVLEEDILLWEDAANKCEFLREHVVQHQKEQMALEAQAYRARANALRALLEQVKQSE